MFKLTKSIISQINDYLENVKKSSVIFKDAFRCFLTNNNDEFEMQLTKMTEVEHNADILKRNIENMLYKHSLIPESRGDVWRLIEHLDELIDTAKEILVNFDIEKPDIPSDIYDAFFALSDTVTASVQEVVEATKLYFYHPAAIKKSLENIYQLEKKADQISNNLKREIFSKKNLELSHKTHIRYFISRTDLLADTAETVADMLSIYAIKLIV